MRIRKLTQMPADFADPPGLHTYSIATSANYTHANPALRSAWFEAVSTPRSGRSPTASRGTWWTAAGLSNIEHWCILVSMTRMTKSKPIAPKIPKTRVPKPQSGYWLLQDAKARFSELVRKVHSEGPQHVTVHGREEVVVIAAEEFRRLKGSATGSALIEAMQASPHRKIDIAPKRVRLPVRDVSL